MSWWTRFKNWLHGVDISDDVQLIQAMVVKSCGFLPTASTVAAILTAGNPTVLTASAIAGSICAAVKASSLVSVYGLLGGDAEVPTVNGVKIEGEFVR